MSDQLRLTISGAQRAQLYNLKVFSGLTASDELRIVGFATAAAHKYLVNITHVETGAYRSAQRMELVGKRGHLYVDPSAVNPDTGEKPVDYSIYEEERGGEHAAYERTTVEAGPKILKATMEMITKEILYGR